jgi:hypothetical protein
MRINMEPTYSDYLGTLATNLRSLAYQIGKLRESEPAMLRFPHSTHRIEDTESLVISMIEDAKLAIQLADAPPTLSFGRVIEGQTIGDKFGDQS